MHLRKWLPVLDLVKAYIKGYEIVNKETKYLTVDKAKESVTSDNVTLKTKGLPTYSIKQCLWKCSS